LNSAREKDAAWDRKQAVIFVIHK
jgi:hypothetical protein